MLKLTMINLELLEDYHIYLTVKESVRRGVSQPTRRYSKVNNNLIIYCKLTVITYMNGLYLRVTL